MRKCINVSDTKMEYIEFGNGTKPFVIIPGLGARSVLGAEDAIINQYNPIISEYHFYLIERPLDIKSGITIEELSEYYYKALDILKINKPVIFGNSMGGMIGLSIAINHLDYIDCLILSSSCARVDLYSKNIFIKWSELSKGDLYDFNKEMALDIYSSDTVDKYGDALINPYMDLTDEELKKFRYLCNALQSFDVYDKLKDIKSPIYFIGSSVDKVFKGERYFEIKEYTKGFQIYDSYSHMVCDEANDFLLNLFDMIK